MVIWADEGYGDQIQFARYVPLLRQRGVSRITLVCDEALKPLLETVDGVDCVISDPFAVPPHDYWSLFMSLPRYFGTTLETIPTTIPYVVPLQEKLEHWQKKLPVDGIRVGLVWKGNPHHGNDVHRSLPSLATLAPLWSIPGITFVSLQKYHAGQDARQPLAGQYITPLGEEIQDFADTAAIVAQLDLTICVDTAVAHVAGALGKPCWVLLPSFHTDWRWLTDRADSPWYPETMRLFRQTRFNDWTPVIEEVTHALQAWALTRPHPNRCATN
ncbi:hypothetical protein D0B32_02690 [Paraburkholderia sp. DHOC27]|nr:hypothetical protein D0B32_02690 [Paraburkholderia sp. DHOC27]